VNKPIQLLVTLIALGVNQTALAQQFTVSPTSPILQGEPVAIVLSGVEPNKEIRISAERVVVDAENGKRRLLRSEATFVADGGGRVDLATAASVRGSHKGVDARGLFWSMSPATDEVAAERVPLEVRLSASGGESKVVASGSLRFVSALPEVKTEKIEAFPGAVFATLGGVQKRPAIILLGGSEGGAMITRGAAPLASHGFAVLALPYYSPKDWQTGKAEIPALPEAFADIAVDRLNEARAWLQARADVDGTRIAIHGTSKGAEFALLAGVHLGWPSAIVAIVPTDVVWEGWGAGVAPGARSSFSVNGKPLPFVPYKDFGKEFAGSQTNSPIYIRRPQDNGRAANSDAAVAARIPVERIKAPVMVVGGHDDQIWASGMMAQNIAERRAEAKLETLALIYPKAGHYLSGNGFNSTTQHNAELMKSGGTPEADAQAQAEAWPQAIAFLKKHLNAK
jgi:dienelactone hydrolase